MDWFNTDHEWRVPSSSERGSFRTVRRSPKTAPEQDKWTCTCPGYRYKHFKTRGYECRHIREVTDKIVSSFISKLK